MKQKINFATCLSIGIIIVAVIIAGYLIINPNKQTTAQGQNQEGNKSAPIVDGKQVIQMTVKAVAYSPNYFKVKVGVPVRWEITSSGEPGCGSGEVIANGLTDPIYLNPNQGQVTVKEFTPQNTGTYQFACPMGMIRGTIEVVN